MQLYVETGLGRVWELHKYLEFRRWFWVAGAHHGNHGKGGELPKKHMRRMPRTESRNMALFKELLEKETE